MKLRRVLAFAVVFALLGSVGFGDSQRRTERYQVGPFAFTGVFIGSCGTFEVLNDWVAMFSGIVVYDKSAQFVQEVAHIRLLGESVYYNSTDPSKAVSGAPAENENGRTVASSGLVYGSGPSFKVRVPGYGVIFMETGHYTYNPGTGEYEFNSGHNQYVDEDVAALCDYLK